MSNDSAGVTASKIAAGATRLYYLDWLRVLAMFSIFFFHNARFFDSYGWHVKSAETSIVADTFIDLLVLWIMPIFFILAGASIYYAMKFRTAGTFSKERTLRILIPIITLGWFIMSPPQVYLERLTQGGFIGNFFQFLPHYFNGIYGPMPEGNFAFVPMHMWFLWLLFIFSLILLPLFISDKKTGKSPGSRLATLFEKPWTFVVPVLLLAASEVFLAPLGDLMSWGGGWNHLSYLIFFISGYLIFSNERIQENIKKYAVIALIAALVLQAVYYIFQFAVKLDLPDSTAVYLGIQTFDTLRSWLFLMAILGFGSRYLNFNNRFLGYTNEAVLPFYILHQTVILIIGFFVVQWSIGIAPKYFIITTSSFIAIMAIYELLVRRVNVLRFLFGMRLKKKQQ